MILYRYLTREILLSTLAVTCILLLVILGSRFARVLSWAASGRLSVDALWQVTLLYLPHAGQMILPIAFVLGLLLVLGRLSMDSEMSVIQASGVSQRQVLSWVLILALVIAAITALASLLVTPMTQRLSEEVMQAQNQRTGFESLTPGQFVQVGDQAVYVVSRSEDERYLNRVLIVQSNENEDVVIVAEQAFQQIAEDTLSRFLVLESGQRYTLPDETSLSMSDLAFERYATRLGTPSASRISEDTSMMSLKQLWGESSLAARVELQWRFSLPAMILVMVLIALPFSQVNPRQGRFMALLPVLCLQMIFLTGLMSLQDSIVKGQWPLWPGLWGLHLLFAAFGAYLCWRKGVFAR